MPDNRADLIHAWKQWWFKPSSEYQANRKQDAVIFYAREISWTPTFLHDTITRRLREGMTLDEAIP